METKGGYVIRWDEVKRRVDLRLALVRTITVS